MAALSSKFRFGLLHLLLKRHSNQGFTLTELLVAILISGLVVVGLLTLVVDLLQNEQRDSARNETQREMQLTMDYIVQDMREAVYVYDGGRFVATPATTARPFSIPPIQNYLPDLSAQDGAQPVLVFWKPESIPYQSGGATIPFSQTYCTNTYGANDPRRQECVDLQVSRRTYSLVAYYQTTSPATAPWRGRSRLIRYVLRKYTDVGTLAVNNSYADPYFEPGGIFPSWPLDSGGTSRQAARPGAANSTVLADFVDLPENNAPGVAAAAPCPSTEYVRTPNATYKSFYACVRPAPDLSNQDAILFLRGSVWGKPGYPASRGNTVAGFLPALQTQILLRGVLDKSGASE